jgi:uncharacterized cupredoxin-like copper-binding protein
MELDEFVIRPNATRARPGTVVFQVTNAGELTHEFLVIKTDLPRAALPRADSRGVDEEQVDVVARLDPIAPGESAELEVQVDEGLYALICNLFADGVSHYLSGMYTGFEVTPTAPPPATPTPAPEPPTGDGGATPEASP